MIKLAIFISVTLIGAVVLLIIDGWQHANHMRGVLSFFDEDEIRYDSLD